MMKKIITYLIKRYGVHKIINDILETERQELNNKLVTNLGSVLYPEARIENHKKDPSKITIGKGSGIRGELLVFNYGGTIEIGDNCYVGEGSRVWSGEKIIIGNNVLISHNVNIIDTNSHELDSVERSERYRNLITEGHWENKGSIITSPIIINDYCWISFNATILKGVTLGKGSIVAAGSVVTKDVPDFAIVAGNPAVIVKYTE